MTAAERANAVTYNFSFTLFILLFRNVNNLALIKTVQFHSIPALHFVDVPNDTLKQIST
jgi:hypothetical protein